MAPLISAVMSVYNGERFVGEAIGSILSQTYPDLELLIVDDGSTDRSLEIIETYAKKDDRVRVIKNNANEGLTKSLIKAIGNAKGMYLARQDADDISLPQRLERQLDFLEKHPSCGAVGTAARIIDSEGNFIKNASVPGSWFMIRQILRFGNCFLHGSMMFRKDAYVNAGGYRAAFRVGQDFDLWLRISKNRELANLGERLYCWRKTEGNISSMQTEPQFKIGALALYDHRHNKHLALDSSFEINDFINSFSRDERIKYDLCLRDLCLRHGNIAMAKKHLDHGMVNSILIMLAALIFSMVRLNRN